MATSRRTDPKTGGKGGAAAAPPSLVDVFPLWEVAAAERDAPGAAGEGSYTRSIRGPYHLGDGVWFAHVMDAA
jgi:hypothetical protein